MIDWVHNSPTTHRSSFKTCVMTYRMVVLLLIAGTVPLANGAVAQQNGGFEATKSSSDPIAHWKTHEEGYEVTVTADTAYEGSQSLRMRRTASERVGVATQTLEADSLGTEGLRLSGYIKTQDVVDGFAGLWVRVDGAHREGLILKNMSDHGVKGTRSWRRYEVEMPVPEEADHIHFGALMPGDGTAWFDSIRLEELGSNDLPPPSDEARAYLNRALDVMEKRSINRDSIDWSALRDSVMRKARGIETTEHTYWALRYAIGRLGDEHSSLRTPRQMDRLERGRFGAQRGTSSGLKGKVVKGDAAYLRVPRFTQIGSSATAFADSLQRIIARLDQKRPCGWIVDLRPTLGGNMWPMIAGLGPILGEGKAGAMVRPDGKKKSWWYRDGKAGIGDSTVVTVSDDPYQLSPPRPPVAVLTGSRTASSGEAVAVSFRERPNAKSFGQATRGLSTSNAAIPLSDGATLFLTTATFADRTGTVYGEPIEPDVKVESADTSSSLAKDPVVEAGRSWLRKQPRCSSRPKQQ
jgi:carboxyl-terminal processing protease